MNIHEIAINSPDVPHRAKVQQILAEFFHDDTEKYWNEEKLRYELSWETEYDDDGNCTNDIVEEISERLPTDWVAEWTGYTIGDAENFIVQYLGRGPTIETIADEFARLAPDWLDDFHRYAGVYGEYYQWHSVWALDDDGIGHRIISIHADDIPALAERMRALPDGALNDERLYRGHALFHDLLVVV